MLRGTPRVCAACGARHRFFHFSYEGRRVHSAVKEEITLGCRKCMEPLMEWTDKDGDTFHLVLEDTPLALELSRRVERDASPVRALGRAVRRAGEDVTTSIRDAAVTVGVLFKGPPRGRPSTDDGEGETSVRRPDGTKRERSRKQ